MKRTQQAADFERLAFECAIREHPGCVTTQNAFRDWLEEHGHSNRGAKAAVLRLARLANEDRQRVRIQELVNADGKKGERLRRRIREIAGTSRSVLGIEIVSGGQRPEKIGDLGYWYEPATGRRDLFGGPVDPSFGWVWMEGTTVSVVVGAAWVAIHLLLEDRGT